MPSVAVSPLILAPPCGIIYMVGNEMEKMAGRAAAVFVAGAGPRKEGAVVGYGKEGATIRGQG
jgi:hypothetical protein